MDREAYNNAPVVAGNKRVAFLNNCLVRKHHINRANGIISFYNITKDQIESCFIADFKKNSEKAYSVKETALLLDRHHKHLYRLISQGVIPPPIGATKDGERAWRIRAYYSASQVKEIRDILASRHFGRERKDGLITNNKTPTAQELTRRMGEGILTYTRTEDGQFVPVWSESI
jgi:hypothetical protein